MNRISSDFEKMDKKETLSLGYVPKILSWLFIRLLNRLENDVGISGIALAWLKSYLSDRY